MINFFYKMPDYFIYKIFCDDCDCVYIGSTENLDKREKKHKTRCNNPNDEQHNLKIYKTIREYGGWENWTMICIEECDKVIETKLDARKIEQNYIDELNATLNSQRAYRSEEQRIEDNKITCKKWREENEEHYKTQRKEYREENKEKVQKQKAADYEKHKEKRQETNKNWREENKEKLKQDKHEEYERNKDKYLERAKNYREENPEKIKEIRQEKIQCGCGVSFSRNDKARHCRSLKHQNWINKDKVNEFALIQFDINMNKIKEFDSPKQAADELNICHKKIGKCCRGAQKTAEGFIFKYNDSC